MHNSDSNVVKLDKIMKKVCMSTCPARTLMTNTRLRVGKMSHFRPKHGAPECKLACWNPTEWVEAKVYTAEIWLHLLSCEIKLSSKLVIYLPVSKLNAASLPSLPTNPFMLHSLDC